jgi:hypothetical protein
MIRKIAPTALALLAGAAVAKLPAPTPEAAAKADEAKAKTAWSDKVAAYQLCKAQDKIAVAYRGAATKASDAQPVATPPCTDPGPFAYTPANALPIEQSGAHSPPQTATAPPSTTTPAAATTPKR